MDANDVQRIASELRQMVHDLEKRVDIMESKMREDAAVEAERQKNEVKDLDRLSARIGAQEAIVNRLVWIVVGGIITAFVTYTISGGLNIAAL